ncbi:MAG: fatty acid desaturase [Candidatus Solibacter sp.]
MAAECKTLEQGLRAALRPLRRKSTALACALLTLDILIYTACFYGAAHTASDWRGWCFGCAEGVAIAMLFIVGHDACHGSYTAHRALNGVLGRVAFLPSLTPFRTWELGHNQTHHVYTNLKTRDVVWTPFSKAEYDRLPPVRRALEHLYRSAPGVGLYYAIEIWWHHLWRPLEPGNRRDCALCWGYALAVSLLALRSGWQAWLVAVVFPLVLWNWLMGWAIYEHHTHPEVPWFDNEEEWRAAGGQLACTVHIVLPVPADTVLHFIMQHTAHHLDVTIPLYHLRDAQRLVEASGARVVTYRWSPLAFLRHLRSCKLYDFERGCWTDFEGRPSSGAR